MILLEKLPNWGAADLPTRLALFREHVETVVVTTTAAEKLAGVVRFPTLQPAILNSLVFYGLAPLVALWRCRGRHAVIVCRAPYEAILLLLAARLVPGRHRPRVVVEVVGDWRAYARYSDSRWRRALEPLADRVALWTVAHADIVATVSEQAEGLIRRSTYKGEIRRYLPVWSYASFMEVPLVSLPDVPQALFVGRLDRGKGVDALIGAWSALQGRVPAARLLIVGDGPERRNLETLAAASAASDGILFAGPQDREQVRELLDRSYCLVLPSLSEGLPLVVQEAMARARAVIGTRAGGIPDLVRDGVSGRLVEPGDVGGIADALIDVLSDRSRARAMGKAGRERLDSLDPQSACRNWLAWLATWARHST